METRPGELPVLIRTRQSAPLGLYGPEALVAAVEKAGYAAVGAADRESLVASLETGQLAVKSGLGPLYALELLLDAERTFPILLVALEPHGIRQLLGFHEGMHRFRQSSDVEESREAHLPEKSRSLPPLTGEGVACLVEAPIEGWHLGKLQPTYLETWLNRIHQLFRQLPQARFYLRMPTHLPPTGSVQSGLAALLDLSARTGLSPIVLPVAAFLKRSDGTLYSLGRKLFLETLEAEGRSESEQSLPTLSQRLYDSLVLRPSEMILQAYRDAPSALENARRLVQRTDWEWRPGKLQTPVVHLGRGYNPETRLWDRIQQAAEHKLGGEVGQCKERLYQEFSAIRKYRRVELMLALAELYARLPSPELVTLPERMTRGLLSAYVLNLSRYHPLDLHIPFQEEQLKHLRSPIILHIPDGFQPSVIKILGDLFGAHSIGLLPEEKSPSGPIVRRLAAEMGLAGHSEATPYLQQCGMIQTERIRWVAAFSHDIDGEIPTRGSMGARSAAGIASLGLTPSGALSLPSIVFEMVPEANQTRLWNLKDRTRSSLSLPAPQEGLESDLLETIQEILPVVFPRYNPSAVWLVFHLLRPRNRRGIEAAIGLLELERHDRPGFLKAVKTLRQSRQKKQRSIEKRIRLEQQRKNFSEILEMTEGLFLFRDQLLPLLEKVLGIPRERTIQLAHQILPGNLLPSNEKVVAGIVNFLHDPEVSYPVTQFLSFVPRYLSARHQVAEWTVLVVQFAALATEKPLEFAREILNETSDPHRDLAAMQLFLEKRGKRILGPNINKSDLKNRVEGDGIRLGFLLIELIGPVTGRHIVKRRGERPFESLDSLVHRTSGRLVNRRVLKRLAISGALDSLWSSRSFATARLQSLEAVTGFGQRADRDEEDKLQQLLFDLGPASEPQDQPAPEEEPPAIGAVELMEMEQRIFSVLVSRSMQSVIDELLPCDLNLEPPSRRQRWLGAERLQVGVLQDVWPWLDSEHKRFTLSRLYGTGRVDLIVAEREMESRLVHLEKSGKPSSLVFVLGRFGGRPREVDRLSFGLLPSSPAPELLGSTTHFFMRDFEPVRAVIEAAGLWKEIEIQVDQVQPEMIREIRNAFGVFRIEPRGVPGCRPRFRSTVVDFMPPPLQQLEKWAVLPTQMLLRLIRGIEGVRNAEYREERPEKSMLLF